MKFGFFGYKLPIEQYSANRTVMYETHFGLNKKPFRALATGSDVFVGPQTATTIAGLKKALATPDSIVAVSGPAGSGKTTLVRRALEAIGDQQLTISIGRIQLGHDEVLELLLEEMGAEVPAGTVQRFTTFRRLLRDQRDKGTRIFVVVEDAARVGIDALSELEALTATDAGVSDGANIVLMGDEDLEDILNARRLVRLKQRLKLRQKLSPLGAGELTAYFKHCFRLAGNEFDTVFEPGTAEVLHALSGGIPRMANNVVESALISAAENKQQQVGVATVKLVATEEFGLDTGVQISEQEPQEVAPVEVAPVKVAPVAEEPEAEDEIPDLIQDTLPDLAIIAPALANPPAVEKPAVEQVIETAAVEEDSDEPIPTLSDSADGDVPPWERDPTLAQLRPDLDALEHAMAVAQGLEPDEDDDSEQAVDDENIPELVPEITLDREIQAKIDEATELLKQAEQEETEAEASDAADETKDAPKPVVEGSVTPKPPTTAPKAPEKPAPVAAAPAPPPPPKVVEKPPEATPVATTALRVPEAPAATPEIVKTAEPQATEVPVVKPPVVEKPVVEKPVVEAPVAELPAEAPPVEEPPVVQPPAEKVVEDEHAKADPELEKIAVSLARAKTIDDCDDKMAETLFGEEFSMMAAQVAANSPAELSANDELELAVPDFDGAAAVGVETKSESALPESNLDGSASQRLRTVRALNADPSTVAPPPVAPVEAAPAEPPPPSDQPVSIEDQINTSMTQTLKALSDRPDVHDDDDEDSKGGFFSRFRR
jgi:type II secretory pathway predicted ATPase ExeA